MNNSNTTIFTHDNEIDVTHKINTIELDNWINHLKYIKKELQNLIGLYSGDVKKGFNSISKTIKFEKKNAENENLLSALQRYQLSRQEIIECEDMQCDMVFITEHESYRHSYLYHLDKYRRLKDEFFNEIQGKLKLPTSKL